MKSKVDKRSIGQIAVDAGELPDEPKTPHEEVMFVVESTNDIVSKILEKLEDSALVHIIKIRKLKE